VQNYYLIEVEAAHRRCEWERAVVAAAQRDQARPQNGWTRWSQLALRTLAHLRSLAALRVPVPSWNPAGVKCARALEGSHVTGT
jgi:hypothetical protein